MNERPIFLRIFSGPHLGATVALPPGGHVLGTDDSCDVILRGGELAPRHAGLEITAADDGSHVVHVLPLDGQVRPGYGEPFLSEKAEIAEGDAFILGATILAWAEDDTDEAWTAVVERLRGLLAPPPPQPTEPDPMDAAANDRAPVVGDDIQERNASDDGDDANNEAVGEAPDGNGENRVNDADETPDHANKDVTSADDVGTSTRRPWTWAAAVAVVAACGAMAVGLYTEAPARPDNAAFLDGILREQGFDGTRAVKDGDAVAVVGSVTNDAQRGRLVRLARNLQFPVYIDVQVDDDMATAVRQSFNSRGIFPGVTSDHRTIDVTGYVKDELIESWALDRVREDVPALTNPENGTVTLRRRIMHASDIAPLLGQALDKAGLGHVGIVWLPGRIRLEAPLTAEQHATLDGIVKDVQAELGVPVEFDVETCSGPSDLKKEVKAVKPNGFLFSVTAAMTKPMPFVCLDTGEKVFIGGLLPGGYTLTAVDVRTLTLRKDGKTTLYHLRGAQ